VSRLRELRPSARATGTLALGALALHELRYVLGVEAGLEGHQGHAYMAQAVPVVVALATALLATTVLAPLGGRPLGAAGCGVAARTGLYAGMLLTVFAAQELAEGALSGAPWEGAALLLTPGGLVAVPLALALGVATALATRGLEGVERRLALAQCPALRGRRERARRGARAGILLRPLAADALAFGIARRPPPVVLPA
jgi:hypothetical protein